LWEPEDDPGSYFGKQNPDRRFNMLSLSENIRREQRSDGGCRAMSSRVPADPKVGEGGGQRVGGEGGGRRDN